MLLRPGNAGSDTTDHRDVLAAALRQVPVWFRTVAGPSPRTSPPIWLPGPASSASSTTRTCGKPTPARCVPGLALEGRVPHLLAAALRPAGTRLTSSTSPSDTRGNTARHGRSRCAPGHTGHHHATAPEGK
jgi:hypothetical protein